MAFPSVRPGTMGGQSTKIPAKLCLNGRLWTQFGRFVSETFRKFRKKTISRGDLGQHRPEKFSSRCWIRRGAISSTLNVASSLGAPTSPWWTALTLRPVICGGRRPGFCYKHMWRSVCRKLRRKLSIVSQRAKNRVLRGCDGTTPANSHALGHGSR